MLTHPRGGSMLINSISGLDLSRVDKILVTILDEHEQKYAISDLLTKELEQTEKPFTIYRLGQHTNSQVETVLKTIELADLTLQDSISINDTDNYFETDKISMSNSVLCVNLEETNTPVKVANKSYAVVDDFGILSNIVEKRVMSHLFCCGLYNFRNVGDFQKYSKIKTDKFNKTADYISQVIYNMIMDDYKFDVYLADNYLDWGDEESWNNYCNQFQTYFIDFDGCLAESFSKFSESSRFPVPLPKNVKRISELSKSGFAKIIITTARPYKELDLVQKFCQKYEIDVQEIVMGCYHSAGRTIINDIGPANKNPCRAISLVRDADNLEKYV